MKGWVLHTMLVVYLMSATEYHELLRLPFLIEHFLEHHSAQGVDLPGFLETHYLGKEGTLPDPDHQHLPFKSCDPIGHSIPALADVYTAPEVAFWHSCSQAILPLATDTSFLPPGVEDSVWRPPQA